MTLDPSYISFSDYFNSIVNVFIFAVGIVTVSKYLVLYFVKGIIKFKFIKNKNNKIVVREYIFFSNGYRQRRK